MYNVLTLTRIVRNRPSSNCVDAAVDAEVRAHSELRGTGLDKCSFYVIAVSRHGVGLTTRSRAEAEQTRVCIGTGTKDNIMTVERTMQDREGGTQSVFGS